VKLIIDNFAGGGGASTGIEAAIGRSVDVAINHDEAAIAVHAANHPGTRHYCQSIYSVDPLDATGGKPVALVWFSPDCKHHSKAKGGKPRDKYIRDLAHVVPHWIERLKRATPGGSGAPDVIMLENVEEFRQWGPLDPETMMPIKERRGEEFDLWVRRIRKHGYKVEWRELRACDYGAPTSRKRLFLIARRDARPIIWPAPTHGKPGTADVLAGKLLPWRSAAECIDWSLPCPSIFDRPRPLKDATCRRIAAGVMRYVVNSARPFIVPICNTGWTGARAWSADEPLRTITTAKGGEMAAVTPFFARTAHGDVDSKGKRRGRGQHEVSEPFPTIQTSQDSALIAPHLMTMRNSGKPHTGADEPLHTIVADGAHKMLVGSGLVSLTHHGGDRVYAIDDPMRTVTGAHRGETALSAAAMIKLRNNSFGEDAEAPLGTITGAGLHHGIAAATMIQTGYGERDGQAPRALDIEAPLGTIVAGGGKHAQVAAFMAQHNTERGTRANPGQPADKPLSTITGRGTQQQLVKTTLIEADALPPDMLASAVKVAAFLIKYYGSEVGQHQPIDAPFDTITAKPRFAVITVTIDAVTFVLVDIGMRMLEPRELAKATGFPDDYILNPVCWYRTDSGNLKYGPLPKSQQIAKIGNAVPPVFAEALVRANLPEMCDAPADQAAVA
jgi:DNA (cytosine-5)-methyltransferase 1